MRTTRHLILILLVGLTGLVTACGGATARVALVSAPEAAETIADNPGHIILDVRTPEEFDAGHIDGAINIDFYAPDFADRIAGLDPNAPYVLYCRSGNRSGATAELMADLSFTAVDEIDGGVLAWTAAGLPLTTAR